MDTSSFSDTFLSVASGVDAEIDKLRAFLANQLDIDDIDDFDMESIAEALVAVRELQSNLAEAERAVAHALERIMPVGAVLSLPDAGVTVEKVQGQKRTAWDHDALKSIVAETVIDQAIDPETGTVEKPLAEIIHNALDMAGISRWQVKKLRAANINPDLYSKKSDGKISFRIGSSASRVPFDEDEDFLA